jgi:gliding motility-associated-like protein
VGTSTYSSSGNYSDILTAANGCDSTIYTNLVVLTELTVDAVLVSEASALNANDGVAQADVNGGAGGYTFLWSDASTTQQVNNLTGGQIYCVTVTDAIGCTAEDCVIIYFPVNILSLFENDTLDCAGDIDGQLIFSAFNGQAPYSYTWQNSNNSLNGNGTILTEGGIATISNLPPDNYSIEISDQWGSFFINIEIVEPEPIVISINNQTDASCFAECDGSISINLTGGEAPYQYLWSGGVGNSANIDLLCAGNYIVTVTDANDCTQAFEVIVGEPEEFIIEAIEVNPVACFGGNDGVASVTTNGNPISFIWSNNETTQIISNLIGGTYSVTVVNTDNCTAESSIIINEPLSAISTNVFVETPISCNDGSDGEATIVATGGTGFSYSWSNGNNNATANNLSDGFYYVTATDINGCIAMDSIQLVSPDPIQANFTAIDVNCPGGDFSGIIMIDAVNGGTPSYLFSLDGNLFYSTNQFDNLTAGDYNIYVEDSNGCIEIFEETVGEPDAIFVNLGSDKTIRLGESITLEAESNSSDLIYNWSPLDTLNCQNCSEITTVPFETTIYAVTVTDVDSGCSASDEVVITVKKDRSVFIPNTFTPNFDGDNDVFKIFSGKSVSKINTFKIFNRWGSLMYEAQAFLPDDSRGWDGTYRGEVMDVGVYVYFAEIEFIDGEKRLYKGDVTLLK